MAISTNIDNQEGLFGSVGNLGKAENDAVTFDNIHGYSTIAIRVTAPTSGVASFEGSIDGTNWEGITLRSIKNDIFEQTTDNNSDFIGSISGFRKFRVRTSTAGSANGTVMGRATREVSTLEGIEFGYPPHRFGFKPVHKDASYTTAQTGTAIWTPATGSKFVVTDLAIIVGGTTDGTVTIFDETDTTGNRLFKGAIEVATNKQFRHVHPLRTPYVSSAIDNVLKVTTTANMTVDIILHGYEV